MARVRANPLLIIVETLAILLAAAAIYSVRTVVLGALLGIGIGILMNPGVGFLHRKYRIPNALSAALFLLLLLCLVGTLIYFLINTVSTEIAPLFSKLPEMIRGLQEKVKNPQIANYLQSFNPERSFGGVAQTLFAGVRFGANSIASLVFVAFTAIYFCVRPGEYLDGFVSLFPRRLRPQTRSVLHECACSLRQWIWAQGLAMLIVGTLAAIALLAVGSKSWLFLGITTGVLELIPYFGPLIAISTVTLITAAGDPSALIKTDLAFLVLLTLEGNVIVPVVMRGRIRLPPIHLLVMMAVLGEWFGIFGFLVAAPTLAIVRTIHLSVLQPKLDGKPAAAIPERPAA